LTKTEEKERKSERERRKKCHDRKYWGEDISDELTNMMKKKKPSRRRRQKKMIKTCFLPSVEIFIFDSLVNIEVVASNVVICSGWPLIQRYSWICGEVVFVSSRLFSGVNAIDCVVVLVDGFVLFVRVIRRNKCFKNRYRAKQQSFSK
jgi:hypothetical protein